MTLAELIPEVQHLSAADKLKQFATANLRSQIATSSSASHGGRRYLPYAFTEHGALMAASILNTPRAIDVSVYVVRAFVKLREMLSKVDSGWRTAVFPHFVLFTLYLALGTRYFRTSPPRALGANRLSRQAGGRIVSNGWTPTALGTVLQPVDRSEPLDSTAEYRLLGIRLDGNGPFLREQRLGSEIAAKRLSRVCEGDFIYSRLFAWRGAFGVIDSELDGAFVSNEFPTFVAKPETIDVKFLNLWFRLKDTLKIVEADCTGSTPLTRNRYKEPFFLALTIPLPPLLVQRRIVAKVAELAAKVEEAMKLKAASIRQRETIVGSEVRQLFANASKPRWNSGALGQYVIDTSYGTSEKTNSDGIGTPILRMGNIQGGRLDVRDLAYLSINQADRGKLVLERGDIVVNRTNSAELVGKCAVFDLDGEYGYASYLIRIRLDTAKAEPRLIATYINSPMGREYMFRERKQMTGQANVNAKKLLALPIALPPLLEQRGIVAHLDDLQAKVDGLKASQNQTQAQLDALLPSILDKAFKGEL